MVVVMVCGVDGEEQDKDHRQPHLSLLQTRTKFHDDLDVPSHADTEITADRDVFNGLVSVAIGETDKEHRVMVFSLMVRF